jgi:nucleotide-binding universal stress UspA family protein
MPYNKLLIAIDSSSHGLLAAKKGFELANMLNAYVGILFVIDRNKEVINGDLGILPGQSSTILLKQAEENIDQVIKMYDGRKDIFRFTPEGFPKEEIIKIATQWEADLIIMGSHGRTGLFHLLMGSVTEYVIRHSPVPVMVVPSV